MEWNAAVLQNHCGGSCSGAIAMRAKLDLLELSFGCNFSWMESMECHLWNHLHLLISHEYSILAISFLKSQIFQIQVLHKRVQWMDISGC